jgi:hypothetical protein
VRQPLYVSNEVTTIGGTAQHQILGIAKNLVVSIEAFTGFGWKTIHVDTNIGTGNQCIKCYKVWGTVFNPQWDMETC